MFIAQPWFNQVCFLWIASTLKENLGSKKSTSWTGFAGIIRKRICMNFPLTCKWGWPVNTCPVSKHSNRMHARFIQTDWMLIASDTSFTMGGWMQWFMWTYLKTV